MKKLLKAFRNVKILHVIAAIFGGTLFLSSGLNRHAGVVGEISHIVWYSSVIGLLLIFSFLVYLKPGQDRYDKVFNVLKLLFGFCLVASMAITIGIGFKEDIGVWSLLSTVISALILIILFIFDVIRSKPAKSIKN